MDKITRTEQGKLIQISGGLEFENDFGRNPLGLGHFCKDQGFIAVASLVGFFLGSAIMGLPMGALVVLVGLNDITFAGRDDEPEPTQPEPKLVEQLPESEAIEVEAKPVKVEPPTVDEPESTSDPTPTQIVEPTPSSLATPQLEFALQNLIELPLKERASAIIDQLLASDFDLSRCIREQITCICGNQRGGKGTLMAILAILMKALEPTTKIHYFTAGDDVYPFQCDRLICRLSYPKMDGTDADRAVASELYKYLKFMDEATQAEYRDIVLVIDEAVALSDYLDPEQKQWIIRFLLTRANKKGAQVFVVLHGINLTSWVGTGNTGGFSSTFKSGAAFIGCEATSKKISPLRSISVATGRYFLADPDNFSKPVQDGDLGVIPEWLKTQVSPITGQPDPVRALLTFFPELRDESHSSLINPIQSRQQTKKALSVELIQQQEEALASSEPTTELKVSDSLGEPLKTIWLMAKERADWVTVRDIQRKDFAILKGKGSEQIHQYLGLLADSGYGEIDEEGKSHSSVRFKPN